MPRDAAAARCIRWQSTAESWYRKRSPTRVVPALRAALACTWLFHRDTGRDRLFSLRVQKPSVAQVLDVML